MEEYGLHIRRYGRNLKFNTLEELKEELGQYFTKSQIANGVIDRLTSFGKIGPDGYAECSYQDYQTFHWVYED
jgi:hypothetical protein